MKKALLISLGAVVAAAGTWAQLRIQSFGRKGQLTWTNSVYRGLYQIESATSPAGPWSLFSQTIDSNPAVTNRIDGQVSLTNGQGFYRVGWVQPDAVGVWEYQGYDYYDRALVVTGELTIPSMTLISSNPVNPLYDASGTYQLQYVGPPTNAPYWLGTLGTGSFHGTLALGSSDLTLYWPVGCADCETFLGGNVWGNTYTGRWGYVNIAGGVFTAVRVSGTNLGGASHPPAITPGRTCGNATSMTRSIKGQERVKERVSY